MKIKTVELSYPEVLALPAHPRKRPRKPSFFLRSLVRVLSVGELKKVRFKFN